MNNMDGIAIAFIIGLLIGALISFVVFYDLIVKGGRMKDKLFGLREYIGILENARYLMQTIELNPLSINSAIMLSVFVNYKTDTHHVVKSVAQVFYDFAQVGVLTDKTLPEAEKIRILNDIICKLKVKAYNER